MIEIFELILNKILDAIYPPKCIFCGKDNRDYICKAHLEEVEKIYNLKVIKRKDKVELISLFKYDNLIRDLLIDYKFNEKVYYYNSFIKFIINNQKLLYYLKTYDIIIPVPIHRKRMKERGYNQAGIIAKKLAKILNIDYIDLVQKNKNNKPQSSLDKQLRKTNVENVYGINNRYKNVIINNKKILIIDDIYTTGNTTNEIIKVITNNFNIDKNQIGIFVIAK
jgi:competence protein ComFC